MLTFNPFQTSIVWKLPDPDTQHLHTGRTRAELVSNIVNYRAQNGLPKLDSLDLVIDNYLCTLPENLGKCRPVNLRRGLLQYLKGGLTLISNIWYGEKNMVTQEEAERRAKICEFCPCNTFPDKGLFIAWSDNIMQNSVGDKRVSNYELLGNCDACTCTLKAKVWLKKGNINLTKDESDKMHLCNDKCWQLKD